MPRMYAMATMYVDLEWTGDVPDDIPEDERYEWVKENICGSEYTECNNSGEWSLYDVVLADDKK
jgi:hypothetical protein